MEICKNFVTTGLPMSNDFTSGFCYEHEGYALDAPEHISAGSSYAYVSTYIKRTVSMPTATVRGWDYNFNF